MRRTSILLDPGLLAELERLARRDGRPTAHVIREALKSYVAQQAPEERVLPAFVGLGHPEGLAVEPASPDEPPEG
jgi:metal-responsive CopG/Arc/MetJ family transcriptional regulator